MNFFVLAVLISILSVALGQEWAVGGMNKYTTLVGVYSTAPNEVYGAVMDNNVGVGIAASNDYAQTNTFYGPIGLMNMDIAFTSGGSVGCMVGLGGIFLGGRPESSTFAKVDNVHGVTQNVEAFSTDSLGVVGQLGIGRDTFNGVVVSTDGGKTWAGSDIGLDASKYYSRYGAFPSDSTWFVSSGMWPSDDNTTDTRLSARLAVSVNEKKQANFKYTSANKNLRGKAGETGWYGAISRTTDAGKTWTAVYTTDQFYFNQIHCADTDNCMAVGENDDGAFILESCDGGNSWGVVFTAPAGMSLVAVRMISPTEAWVSGGTQQRGQMVGYYYHTIDAGANWQTKTATGYSFDLSFNGGVGYSAYITSSYSSVAVYK